MNGLDSRPALTEWAWTEATVAGKWRAAEDLRATGEGEGVEGEMVGGEHLEEEGEGLVVMALVHKGGQVFGA